MSDFREFPKMMVHPAHEPAVLSTIFPLGYKPREGERENPGRPERFPPITVNDANQQEMYEARGYRVQGESSAEAFDEAKSGKPAHYAYDEYPKWLRIHDDDVLVKSQAEEHALLKYNAPKATENDPPKNKGGRPKGSGKSKTDHMAVTD